MANEAKTLAAAIKRGEAKALARAITLCESAKAADFAVAAEMLGLLGTAAAKTRRIGISGAGGVGKSTFIEAIGLLATENRKKTAVLAVDPQSKRGGGAILGDKTRMPHLSGNKNAFVRPSAGDGGGINPATHEAMVCCEAAGFDPVIVETIGSGQSETEVRELVDMFLLLVMPGGGDEVQGIKRGAMELADLVIITKCDGDLAARARLTAAQYSQGLGLMRRNWDNWRPRVLTVSAAENINMDECLKAMDEFFLANGKEIAAARRRQRQRAFYNVLNRLLLKRTAAMGDEKLLNSVADGTCPPRVAASRLLGGGGKTP